jgi:hypothetical protein
MTRWRALFGPRGTSDVAEQFQIMGIGPHRVRTSPRRRELQEVVDQVVADPIDALAVGEHNALERRRPTHQRSSFRTLRREYLPRTAVPTGGSPV